MLMCTNCFSCVRGWLSSGLCSITILILLSLSHHLRRPLDPVPPPSLHKELLESKDAVIGFFLFIHPYPSIAGLQNMLMSEWELVLSTSYCVPCSASCPEPLPVPSSLVNSHSYCKSLLHITSATSGGCLRYTSPGTCPPL